VVTVNDAVAIVVNVRVVALGAVVVAVIDGGTVAGGVNVATANVGVGDAVG
jgi:hypothetical protein